MSTAVSIAQPSIQQKRRPPRMLEVIRTEMITPQMKRVILSGTDMEDFPEFCTGRHIKLFLPRSHQVEPVLPTLGSNGPIWPPADQKPITRTYSVRHYDAQAKELSVDFVLHGDEGPASAWAIAAETGKKIGLAGPAAPEPFFKTADWYFFAGDMTSLPAIAGLLSELPEHSRGVALIEVPSESEIQSLKHPKGMEVHWLIEEHYGLNHDRLLKKVSALKWPSENSFAWLAGENSAVLALRKYFRTTLGLSREAFYAVPYWKARFTEEAYHQERHDIMDNIELG